MNQTNALQNNLFAKVFGFIAGAALLTAAVTKGPALTRCCSELYANTADLVHKNVQAVNQYAPTYALR